MLKTTPTRSTENLPLDIAKDAKVRSGTSSTTRLAENMPSDMAEDAKVGGNGNGGHDGMVKKSSSRKLSGPTEYLTSLRFDANSIPFKKR